jgi:phosphoglycerate dehydrogenase-like enzyme
VRLAILDDFHDAYRHTAGFQRLAAHAAAEVFESHPPAWAGYDVLLANRERTKFTAELLRELSAAGVKLIVQTGGHANHIDLQAAREIGMPIAKASGGSSSGAAELAIGLAIAVMRQVVACDAAVRRGEWPAPLGLQLRGKTLGIVGLGGVGKQVAAIARVCGMSVLAWSPHLTAEAAKDEGCELRHLDELLRESDVVTIHAALNASSRNLLDERRLALLKPTAFLINTARGVIVDQAALAIALAAGRIAGAGLDVFDPEPLPADHPFLHLPNVVLTPHVGYPTDVGYDRFSTAAADALDAYVEGRDFPRFTS